MKKIIYRIAALAMIMILGCGLLACEQTPEQAIARAELKLADITGLHYDMTMDMSMSVAGETMDVSTDMKADMTVDPMAMKMEMTMDMGMLGQIPATVYLAEQEGKFYTYTGIDMGGDIYWQKDEVADAAALTQYDAKASMSLYLEAGQSFVKVGEEEVLGELAVRYDGVITGEDIDRVLQSSGMLEQLTALGIDEQTALSMTDGLGDLPVSIWVADKSGFPVKYEMDMTAMMQGMTEKLIGTLGEAAADAAGMRYDRVFLSMTLSQFNEISPITVPAEALEAGSSLIEF